MHPQILDTDRDRWLRGYGVIRHRPETVRRVSTLAEEFGSAGRREGAPYEILTALDRVASAALWLVIHETYARNVYTDGRALAAEDFKERPEGHTGGALNMVPAYAGYLAANALTGCTRSWLMGQGHTVAAIDSLNLIVGNMTERHAERYSWTDAGLTRYVRDFYSYKLDGSGRQDSPLGSHVNVHTAGGLAEGGYLGFAELQYVHMPLPGERLVVFLSDGAFEEQRGSDWAARWWRARDCGLVAPIMIANGRRIDQRTTMSQQGGVRWFVRHLRLNGFDPIVFDGRDPAAYAWAILEMERRLEAAAQESARHGKAAVRLPYGIAVTSKGYGFPGAGTNAAHNLPLGESPRVSQKAATLFRGGAQKIFVASAELHEAVAVLQRHERSDRPKERDHALAHRNPELRPAASPEWRSAPADLFASATWTRACPMSAVDRAFLAAVEANPQLRPRVGNPDELLSNRMGKTLEKLRHRVTDPEPGVLEDVHGAVITALNEEAVASAALGNEGGLNIVVSYEAFAAKMHGVLRQKVIFTQHQAAAGRAPRWISVPIVLTSHLWENGKNEQSHQDPSLCEAMMAEAMHVSRVLFPADTNSAAAAIDACLRSRGQIWTLVVPKSDSIPDMLTREEAETAVREGGVRLRRLEHESESARLLLCAIGAYQLEQVARAAARLRERKIPFRTVVLMEPARFREPVEEGERRHAASPEVKAALFPDLCDLRLFVTHGHAAPFMGALADQNRSARVRALGYCNQGGTLDTPGLLFLNRSHWTHILREAARLIAAPEELLLESAERDALAGRAAPSLP